MVFKDIVTVPNVITLVRLVLSPVVLPVLLVIFLPWDVFLVNCFLALLFALFAVTDFVDGFVARRYTATSSFGRILDPLADKFLMYSVLVALLAVDKIFFAWALIIIGREFFVLGLRQFALEHNLAVNVSFLGKAKTFAQMVYVTVLIANPYHHTSEHGGLRGFYDNLSAAPGWTSCETLLMIIAVTIAIFSAKYYYDAFVAAYIRARPTSSAAKSL